MWRALVLCMVCVLGGCRAAEEHAVDKHPETDGEGWRPLFAADLSDADYPEGVWTVEGGVLTASKDRNIWTTVDYDDFVLDLEFKVGPNANSGVIVYSVDTKDWVLGSIEVQILDDGGDKWKNISGHGKSGAIYGHVAPSKSVMKPAGAWTLFSARTGRFPNATPRPASRLRRAKS